MRVPNDGMAFSPDCAATPTTKNVRPAIDRQGVLLSYLLVFNGTPLAKAEVFMDVSVIVPIYNVERYLLPCLESVYANTCDLDAEVLLIDDGSTDGSPAIAQTFARDHRGFSYHRKENGGPGHARNYGIARAKGDYLSFIDSDDVFAEGILPSMLKSAKTHSSDLVACDVGRLHEDGKVTYSPIHVDAFSTLTENVTSLSRHVQLLYDSTTPNKLVSRDLYDRVGISFPEGYLYEDIPVAFHWYHRSDVVSVLRYTGYLWRIREAGPEQITQRTSERRNLTDRLAMMERLLDYIEENVSDPSIRLEVERKFIKVDLAKYVYKLPLFEEEDANETVEIIASFFERHIGQEALSTSSLRNQQVYSDVLKRDLAHIEQVLEYSKANYSTAPISRIGTSPIVSLPSDVFTIGSRDQSNDLANSLPQSLVTDCQLEDDVLVLRGHLSFPRIDIPAVGDQDVSAFLLNDVTGQKLPLDCKPCPSPQLTNDRSQTFRPCDDRPTPYCYDGCGFVIKLPLADLDVVDGLEGNNSIVINYSNWAASGSRILRGTNRHAWEGTRKTVIESDRYHGRITSDKRGTLFLSLQDGIRRIGPSVYEADLEPEKVSLIVPVSESDTNLGACLDSLFAQSHRNLEVVIADCSARGTLDPQVTRGDERFGIVSVPQGGRRAALNHALARCTGDHVMFVNTNDVLSPTCVSTLLVMLEEESAQLATCQTRVVGDAGDIAFDAADRVAPTRCGREELDYSDGWLGKPLGSALFARSIIGDTGFSPDPEIDCDTLFLAQVAAKSDGIARIDGVLHCTIEKSPSASDGMRRGLRDMLAWERVASLLEDGPTLAHNTAELNETMTAISTLKDMSRSGSPDPVIRRQLLSHVRGKGKVIRRSGLDDHDKRMLGLFVTFPEAYLGLYGMKNPRR